MKKIVTIVGARPQFVKAAVMSRLLRSAEWNDRFSEVLIHTGQHYDDSMSGVFFRELDLPNPDLHLQVESGGHGRMTGSMLLRIEEALEEQKPDLVLVYGDTNSTLAGALAAAKMGIPVAHVEAGLRSYNKGMPEEINRLLTDNISDWLFCPTQTAVSNLEKENIRKGVYLTGDIMFDAILFYQEKLQQSNPHQLLQSIGLNDRFTEEPFLLATIHRASNTDDPAKLSAIMQALGRSRQRIMLPLHPRTRKMLRQHQIQVQSNVRITEPAGYLTMLLLENRCQAIVTDSGGVQKEAYFMQKPCITLRDETEWTETVESGWNTLAGTEPEKILTAIQQLHKPNRYPAFYGDGQSAEKMLKALLDH
ncbi:MAG: UDP-N-acetylglucosamine 2-epimerase (non-hydrolyzing) [Bacteroidales bacterium]|nr:UDP-N-acetylglucosamine 2-epimerase (non-hydrolyzing) [Bacteroidales bacterium]